MHEALLGLAMKVAEPVVNLTARARANEVPLLTLTCAAAVATSVHSCT